MKFDEIEKVLNRLGFPGQAAKLGTVIRELAEEIHKLSDEIDGKVFDDFVGFDFDGGFYEIALQGDYSDSAAKNVSVFLEDDNGNSVQLTGDYEEYNGAGVTYFSANEGDLTPGVENYIAVRAGNGDHSGALLKYVGLNFGAGVTVPAPPVEGTAVLTSVDGVLQWTGE
jgi:hypothetical protein